MMFRYLFCGAITLLAVAAPAWAQSSLPLVEDVEIGTLRNQCKPLLKALKGKLPKGTEEKLAELLRPDGMKDDEASTAIQKLLDPLCLIGVTINAESRVKAARGPCAAELTRGRDTFVLIKVQNDAGVTHALTVSGDQLRSEKKTDAGRWLEGSIQTAPPFRKTLSGHKLEYVVLRLKAYEAGKREATLKFDAGQGTQDLGFRAEVPVLFKILNPKS
jgi:hypothetical protein